MKSMFAAMLPNRFTRSRDGDQPAHPAERRPKCYWAVTCDIDYFQRYKDIYGRIAADEALRRVTEALSRTCRSEEHVFNRGDARYVIIFEGETFEIAKACAEYHRASVEALQIPHQGSPLGIITLSMGLATIVSGGPEATFAALAKADAALCRAREAGPNQVAAAGGLFLV
jgi:diguanylate cyclase (GGDEF)-like protein